MCGDLEVRQLKYVYHSKVPSTMLQGPCNENTGHTPLAISLNIDVL